MRLSNMGGRTKAVAAGAAILAIAGAGAGTAVAAGHVTSAQIKDGTIQTRDLTKNNFARFTSTETVVTAATPVSANPAYAGQRVVDVAANGTTPIATIVLDKGTWKLNGEAQFWHIGGPNPTNNDLGEVTINGLGTGYANSFSGDIPDGGVNPAQASFSGTITITANDTPVVVYGSITGSNAGQAGAQVTATQYKYVKLFNGGS